MSLENWVVSVSKFKKVVLKITDTLLTRVNLEAIEDEKGVAGVKAVWIGEHGESTIEVDAPSLKGNLKTEGDNAPTVEYWHRGNKRGFAVRHPKDISCEFDEKTLEKISTGKAAGVAAAAGAAVGLLGWFALFVASRAALVKQEAHSPSSTLFKSDTASTGSLNEEDGHG